MPVLPSSVGKTRLSHSPSKNLPSAEMTPSLRCSCALTPQLFGALLHVVDSTGVEERGLGVFVHAAGEDLEAAQRLAQRDIRAGRTGELLGDVNSGWAQEALDACLRVRRSCLSSSLSSSIPRMAMISCSSLILLQRLLHAAGDAVVLLADDVRLKDAGIGAERIHSRINSLLGISYG